MAAATPSFDALRAGSIINSLILGEGDSIMANTGEASNVVFSSRILDQMRTAMTYADEADYKNLAIGGTTIAQTLARLTVVSSLWSHRHRKYNLLCLYMGVNSFVAGRSKEQVLADYLEYIDAAVALKWLPVVGTLVSNVYVANADRLHVNTGLRDAASGHGFVVADCGGDADMGQNGQHSSTTYFRDGSHPTEVGNGRIATYYQDALESIGLT